MIVIKLRLRTMLKMLMNDAEVIGDEGEEFGIFWGSTNFSIPI